MSRHLSAEALERVARDGTASPLDAREHLSGCPECRARARRAAGRQALLAGLRPPTLSALGFRRVEARLMERVDAGLPPSEGFGRFFWLLPVAVAAGVMGLWVSRPPSVEPPSARRLQSPAVTPATAVASLTVLAAPSGARTQREQGSWVPLTAGATVAPGARVAGRGLRMAAEGASEYALEVSGMAQVRGAASVLLEEGELRASVGPDAVDVQVGALHAVATEAAFSLTRTASEVLLEVGEGVVTLWDSASGQRSVSAPQRWRRSDSAAWVALSPGAGMMARWPASPPRPWVKLDAEALAQGTRVSLDGAMLGEAPFTALVTRGRHRMSVAPPSGVARETWVEMAGAYRVEPPAPEGLPPPSSSERSEAQRIRSELERQRPKLRACYERWLKANPTAEADVELRLSVSAAGRVLEASVVGPALDPSAADCLVNSARALVLPPLQGDLDVELPLKLTTQRE